MSKYEAEINRRRTFAIISHPDAGKTTLTEKFLLYGGAIAQAGQVKGKKNTRAATSDWNSRFDWNFSPSHSSSAILSTSVGSVLHVVLPTLQPGHD